MARTLLNNVETIKTVGGGTGYELTTEVLEGDYNAVTNTSPVTTNLYIKGLNGYYYTQYSSPYSTISYNGTEKKRESVPNTSTSRQLICSFTEDIEHDTDGSKKINISTSYNNGGASAYYIPINYTFTANNIELTKIPRNSTFTASSMNYNFKDGNISISTTKYISNAIDKLTVKYNTTTLFSSNNYVSNTQLSPIASAVTSIANANVNNKTCTLVAELKTYVNNEQVGTTQTMNITASFDGDLVINGINCIDTNNKSRTLTGDNTIIVKGLSNVQCTLDYSTRYSGTLDSIVVGSTSYSTSPFTLNAYNSNVINATIKSHRDFSYNYIKTIASNKFVNYSKPTLNASVSRTSQTGDTISGTISGTWFNGNIGATTNTLTAFYRTKLNTASSYGSWQSITLTKNGNNYSGTFSASGFTYTNQYDVQIAICDSYYNAKELYQTFRIMKSTTIFDIGENDVHFRCDVEVDGTLTGTASGNAPINHSSSANTYGLGTNNEYGHCKIVDNITTSASTDGLALSAYQGKVLRDRMDTRFTYATSNKTAGAYDGKTLYRKIVKSSITQTGTSAYPTISTGVTNATKITRCDVMLNYGDNNEYYSPSRLNYYFNKTNGVITFIQPEIAGSVDIILEFTTA